MLTYQFSNGSLDSDDKTCSATTTGKYLDSYQGRNGVYHLARSQFMRFPILGISREADVFVVSIAFLIDKEAKDDRTLFGGAGIPFVLDLIKTDQGFVVEATLKLMDREQSCLSEIVLLNDHWYELSFFLLDGEFFFTIDGQLAGRRVFAGEIEENNSKAFAAFVGTRMSKTVTGGFFGYIDKVSFSNEMTEKQEAQWLSFTDDSVGEFESKEDELAAKGVVTGRLLQENVRLDPSSSCRYNEYENGVIFWSPSYGSVWMKTVFFRKYMEVFKSRVIGIPVADEVCSPKQGIDYCLFDAAGLFLRDGKCIFMTSDFLTEYANSGLLNSLWGLPKEDSGEYRIEGNTPLTFQRFDNVILFKGTEMDSPGKVIAVPNETGFSEHFLMYYPKYGSIVDYFEGYEGNMVEKVPTQIGTNSSGAPVIINQRITTFVRASYITSERSIICCNYKTEQSGKTSSRFFEADKDIFEFLKKDNGLEPAPVDPKTGEPLPPFGTHKCFLQPPRYTSKGTVYQNCVNGVIVSFPKAYDSSHRVTKVEVRGFDKLKLVLTHFSVNKIDDPGLDETPESYIEVFVQRGDQILSDWKRWPEYSKREHGGGGFDIIYEGNVVTKEHPEGTNVFYEFENMHGEDHIRLLVKAFDRDSSTGNDGLGEFNIDLDVDTGWALGSDFLKEEDRGGRTMTYDMSGVKYTEVYASETYGHNRGGRKNLKLSFRIDGTIKPYDLDSWFRKYGYWSIDNFRSTSEVPRELFNETFDAQTGSWYDYLLHPFDAVWYAAACRDHSGKGGLCFGLSAEALLALHDRGAYSLPLNRWNLYSETKFAEIQKKGYIMSEEGYITLPGADGKYNFYPDTSDDVEPGFFREIRRMQLYQLGWQHVSMVIDKAVSGTLLNPEIAFEEIMTILDRDKYCLVNCFGSSAHTVLAYKHDDLPVRQAKIYVADCNHPWLEDQTVRDGSYICLTDTKPGYIELHYSIGGQDKTERKDSKVFKGPKYIFCYATPYSLLTSKPRVPSLLDFASLSLSFFWKLTGFVVNNLADLMLIVCSSGDDVSVEGMGEKDSFVIPAFSADIPYEGGPGLRLFMVPSKIADIHVKPKENEDFVFHVAGRGKAFQIRGKGRKGKDSRVRVSGICSRVPEIQLVKTGNVKASKGNMKALKGNEKASKENASKENAAPMVLRMTKPVMRDAQGELQVTRLEGSIKLYGKHAFRSRLAAAVPKPKAPLEGYYLNMHRQKNGKYEVHKDSCPFFNKIKTKEYLGIHRSPASAFAMAKELKGKVDGCRFCCKEHSTD